MRRKQARAFIAGTVAVAAFTAIACTLARPLDYLTEGAGTALDGAPIVNPEAGGPLPDVIQDAVGVGRITVLARDLFNPGALAQDADNLYWYNADGTVTTMPKAGGPVRTIASRTPPLGASALGVDSDPDGAVFVALADFVIRVPKSTTNGTLTEEVDRGRPPPTALVVDATQLFVLRSSDSTTGSLFRMSKNGANKVLLSDINDDPYGVALEGDSVLWAGSNELGTAALELPKTDAPDASTKKAHSSTTDDVLPDSPRGFAVDREGVFWIAINEVLRIQRTGKPEAPTGVYTGPMHDGATAYQLGLDAQFVFVLDTVDGTLIQVPKTGGTDIKELASKMKHPTSFVVDDKAAYVSLQPSPSSKTGLIVRVEKAAQ